MYIIRHISLLNVITLGGRRISYITKLYTTRLQDGSIVLFIIFLALAL